MLSEKMVFCVTFLVLVLLIWEAVLSQSHKLVSSLTQIPEFASWRFKAPILFFFIKDMKPMK